MKQPAFSYTNSLGKVYFLNHQEVTIKSGKKMVIYFFSLSERAETSVDVVPVGYEVSEATRSKMPLLRKIK